RGVLSCRAEPDPSSVGVGELRLLAADHRASVVRIAREARTPGTAHVVIADCIGGGRYLFEVPGAVGGVCLCSPLCPFPPPPRPSSRVTAAAERLARTSDVYPPS